MFCPKCGKQLINGAKFCYGCGFDLSVLFSSNEAQVPSVPEPRAEKVEKKYSDEELFALWERYSNEESEEYDYPKAVKCLEEAAEKGHLKAVITYLKLEGKNLEPEKRVHFQIMAADAGDVLAIAELGVNYVFGCGTELNFEKGINYLEKAATAGDVNSYVAMLNLVRIYLGEDSKGNEVLSNRNLRKADEWCEKCAATGAVLVYRQIASRYIEKLRDIEKGVAYLEKGAATGDRLAIQSLIELYSNGQYVPANNQEIIKWHIVMAEVKKGINEPVKEIMENEEHEQIKMIAESFRSMLFLGNSYYRGEGIEKNEAEAWRWYTAIPKRLNDLKVGNLSFCTVCHEGMEEITSYSMEAFNAVDKIEMEDFLSNKEKQTLAMDFNDQMKWCQELADAGQRDAMLKMAFYYEHGLGVEENHQKQFSWLLKAAKQGSYEAMYRVAQAYENGDGVEKDDVQAYQWYKKYVNKEPKDAEKEEFKSHFEFAYASWRMYWDIGSYEILAFEYFNEKENSYIFPLRNSGIRLDKDIKGFLDTVHELKESIRKSVNKLQIFYQSKQDIGAIMADIYPLGKKLLYALAELGADCAGDKTMGEGIVNEAYADCPDIPLDIWKKYYNQVNQISNHLVPGTDGTLANMVQAKAMHILADRADDIFASMSDWTKGSGYVLRGEVYKDKRILNGLLAGWMIAAEAVCKRITLAFGYDTREEAEKCRQILDDLAKKRNVSDNDAEEKFIDAFLADLFNMATYRSYLEHFGDESGSLQAMASFLGLREDIIYLKEELLVRRLKENGDGATLKYLLPILCEQKDPEEVFFSSDTVDFPMLSKCYDTLEKEAQYLAPMFVSGHFVYNRPLAVLDVLESIIAAGEKREKQTLETAKAIRSFQFLNSNMKIFAVPEGVDEIGAYAFANCKELEWIILPDSLQYIRAGAFYGCTRLKALDFPKNLQVIEDYAFKRCSAPISLPERGMTISIEMVDSTNIPKNLLYLPEGTIIFEGSSTFSDQNLRFAFDPDPITFKSINRYFERHEQLERADVFIRQMFLDGKYFEKASWVEVQSTEKQRAEVIFSEDVCIIGSMSMADSQLRGVDFPASPFVIGTRAFAHSKIRYIHFQDANSLSPRLRVVHDEAFLGCEYLEECFFPIGTAKIGARVFKGCMNLKAISIPPTVKEIGEDLLNNPDTVIYCSAGSEAARYCEAHNITMRDEGLLEYEQAGKILLSEPLTEDMVKEAAKHYERAQAYGNLDAIYAQGLMFYTQDADKSIAYLSFAAKYGHKVSAERLQKICAGTDEELNNLMTLGQPIEDTNAVDTQAQTFNAAASPRENSDTSKNVQATEFSAKEEKQTNDVNPQTQMDIPTYIASLHQDFNELAGVYFNGTGEKGQRKIENAVRAYANAAKKERIIFCYDDTLFGSAEDGFLVTDQKVYIHNLVEDATSILLKYIETINTEGGTSASIIINQGKPLELRISVAGKKEGELAKMVYLLYKIKNDMYKYHLANSK